MAQFEPGDMKTMKKCQRAYVSFLHVVTGGRNAVPCGCHLLLSAIQIESVMQTLGADF